MPISSGSISKTLAGRPGGLQRPAAAGLGPRIMARESERDPGGRVRRQSTRTALVVWVLASVAGWAVVLLIGLALF